MLGTHDLPLFAATVVAPLRRARLRPWVGRSLNVGGAGLFTLLAAKLAFIKS